MTMADGIAEDISQVGKTPSVIPTPPFTEKGGLGGLLGGLFGKK